MIIECLNQQLSDRASRLGHLVTRGDHQGGHPMTQFMNVGAPKEWRGRFFEDMEVGDVYRSRIGRTVLQTDNTWFTLLTGNTNQVHFNDEFAAATEFGRPLVNSCLTLSIVVGLSVPDTSEN